MGNPIYVNRVAVGSVDVVPGNVRVQCIDSYATITAAGYLDGWVAEGGILYESDIISVAYGTNSDSLGLFQATSSSGIWTLSPLSVSDIALPTIANHIAIYTNTTGGLGEDAATAINAGNIQAGLTTGTAGAVISCPGTTTTGTLQLKAVASGGNYNGIISNASLGQGSTWTLADPGGATSNILQAPSALVSGNFPKNSGTVGKVVDSGFSVPAADASANADSTTIAVPMSSNGSGVWAFSNTLPRYSYGTITLAQFILLYTTPITVIPAPGNNLMVQILSFQVEWVYGSAAPTSGGAVYLQYGTTAHGTNYATPVAGIPAAFFTSLSASSVINCLGNINTTTGLVTSTAGNAAISLTNATQVFATGTSGSLVYNILYNIVPYT